MVGFETFNPTLVQFKRGIAGDDDPGLVAFFQSYLSPIQTDRGLPPLRAVDGFQSYLSPIQTAERYISDEW